MKGASSVNLCVLNLWSFSNMQLSDESRDVEAVIVTFQENQSNPIGDSSHLTTHTQLAK